MVKSDSHELHQLVTTTTDRWNEAASQVLVAGGGVEPTIFALREQCIDRFTNPPYVKVGILQVC